MLLNRHFPDWKSDHKTYMIPHIFRARQSLRGYSSPRDHGENIIYNLLNELGQLNEVGMFVIHGFEYPSLHEEICWNEASEFSSKIGGSDFIIFHHEFGMMLIEVKNSLKISDSIIEVAEFQLEASRNHISNFMDVVLNDQSLGREGLFKSATMREDIIPITKIIALPSTLESNFNFDDFPSLSPSTRILFQDSTQNLGAFQEWWQEIVGNYQAQMTPDIQEVYELVLSYILMVRHMGPVTETDCISKLYELLASYKFHGKIVNIDSEFPSFMTWCWDDDIVKNDKEVERIPNALKDLVKRHKLNKNDIKVPSRMAILMDGLSALDSKIPIDAIVGLSGNVYLMILMEMLRLYLNARELWAQRTDDSLSIPEVSDNLQSMSEEDEPDELDKHLFESLACEMRIKHSRRPIVFTTEQLTVFEGPMKQLIIGPPGSGKTELLRFKALDLESEMEACKINKRIMYIIANGSPSYPERNSLFFYHIKEFFKDSALVDVITIVLEEESSAEMEQTTSGIRGKIESGYYEHVFVDEYWIGSKPKEHKIVLDLVNEIPGYVWISSVFNFNKEMMDKGHEKLLKRTKPLLTALEENGGEVNYLTQVLRTTDNIVHLERGYGSFYQSRSYPYGTEQIVGHSYQGQPVTWIIEHTVEAMYERCTTIVFEAITKTISFDVMSSQSLTLDPSDILIVNFAIRMAESHNVQQSLEERLLHKKIAFWSFGDDFEDFMNCKLGKVTLLQSFTRDASSFLDGVEWPFVVVILPSVMLLNTAELDEGAKELRNYDPYIAFFRAMAKLVVISDKWKSESDFLADIKQKVEK